MNAILGLSVHSGQGAVGTRGLSILSLKMEEMSPDLWTHFSLVFKGDSVPMLGEGEQEACFCSTSDYRLVSCIRVCGEQGIFYGKRNWRLP